MAAAVLVGAFLNALAGFGFALITVPLMATVVEPRQAVVLSAILGLLSNGGVAIRNRSNLQRPIAVRVLIGAAVGMPFGLILMLALSGDVLKILIASAVLGSVVALAAGWRIKNPTPSGDYATGLLSGLFNTSTGIGGPPIVLLLQARGLPRAEFRATASAVFAISGVVALTLFGIGGQFNTELFKLAAVAIPALPAGWVLGELVHRRFDEERFRVLVLVMMCVTAGATLVTVFV